MSIEHLSDVPNPWKGFTMNRCLVLALVVLLISLWDNFMGWWGTEELGAIRRRKKPIGNKSILKPKP
ncbi:hypothetical protein F7725_027501, partial [Dissostichus mawsoni]